MATLLWQGEIEPGVLTDTGLVYQRGDLWIIRNEDLAELDVNPWGYFNYMSEDTPMNGDRILFRELNLALKNTAFKDDTDWIPQGRGYAYVRATYRFTQATYSIYSPY